MTTFREILNKIENGVTRGSCDKKSRGHVETVDHEKAARSNTKYLGLRKTGFRICKRWTHVKCIKSEPYYICNN